MKNVKMRELGDYTLLARMNEENFTIYEYVVAWCYDSDKDCWAQGHYFQNVADAVQFMNYKKMDLVDLRTNFVKDMHEYVRTRIDDENAYMSWICLVPDEPSHEDFVDIASDNELWTDTCKLFGKLAKAYENN